MLNIQEDQILGAALDWNAIQCADSRGLSRLEFGSLEYE